MMFSSDEIARAKEIVYATLPATPQRVWPLMADALGQEVWIKHENLTPLGAFKVRGGLVQPPRVTPRIVGQCITKPVWALERARRGMTRMKTLDKYSDDDTPRDPTQHIGHLLRTAPDWSYMAWLRKHTLSLSD